MNWGMNEGVNAEKMGREVKKREHSFTLLHSLLHPVLIDTKALKKMSAWAGSVCVCVTCVWKFTLKLYIYLYILVRIK